MQLLFHIHTHYSYDCLIKPAYIVDFALKNNIGVIAITDHNTIRGSIEATNFVISKKLNIQVITGAEYYTDCGDIIGLFLKNEINEPDAVKLVNEIHNQGGLAILPHPYKGHKLNEGLLQKVDIIEIFNARCNQEQNQKAVELAKKLNKPVITGSDAHIKSELRLCTNILKDLPLKEALLDEKEFYQSYATTINIINSQMVKGYRQKDVILILKMIKSIISFFIFQPIKKILKFKNSKT